MDEIIKCFLQGVEIGALIGGFFITLCTIGLLIMGFLKVGESVLEWIVDKF